MQRGVPFLILVIACVREPASSITVVSDTATGAGRTIELDHPPGGLVGANGAATALRERWHTTTVDHPVAATFTSDDQLIVADLGTHTLRRIDSTGQVVATLGREGEGPGEFSRMLGPIGVAAIRGTVVALQGSESNTLVSFSGGGRADAVGAPTQGDWNGYLFRRPDIALELPLQSGPELWARRLQGVDDSTAAILVVPRYAEAISGARTVLRELSSDLRLGDTLAAWTPVPQAEIAPHDRREAPSQEEPLWVARPVWAGGGGRLLLGHGDSTEVRVTTLQDRSVAAISWPRLDRPTTDDDLAAMGDQLLLATRYTMRGAEEAFAQAGQEEGRAQVQVLFAERTRAERLPQLMGAWLVGECIWLAGADPSASPEGTARDWLIVDPTVTPARLSTIQLRVGERMLAAAPTGIVTVQLQKDGARMLRMYASPSCARGSR